jgi:PAS domain S-box-containing protein
VTHPRGFGSSPGDDHGGTAFRSGTPLFEFDEHLRIVSWNDAATELLGLSAEDALGRPCWDVLGARDDCEALVCHQGCSVARLALEGWPVPTRRLLVKDADGKVIPLLVDTIGARNGGPAHGLHLLREASSDEEAVAAPTDERSSTARLTPRQLELLHLLADGLSARAIAERLTLQESTVRNHIHAILTALEARSQLEAVAIARRNGVL